MTTEERDRPHILQSYSAIHLEEEIKIDFIVELADRSLIPIEVKWTENPNERDARHLVRFIDENKKLCQKGFIVCRCRRPMQISDKVAAISWKDL